MANESFAESLRKSTATRDELKKKEADQKAAEKAKIEEIIQRRSLEQLNSIKRDAQTEATVRGKTVLKKEYLISSSALDYRLNSEMSMRQKMANEVTRMLKPLLENEGFKHVHVSSARHDWGKCGYAYNVHIRW